LCHALYVHDASLLQPLKNAVQTTNAVKMRFFRATRIAFVLFKTLFLVFY